MTTNNLPMVIPQAPKTNKAVKYTAAFAVGVVVGLVYIAVKNKLDS